MTHSCDGQDARAPTTYEAQLIRSRAQSIAAYGSRLISHGMGPPNQVGPDSSQGGNLGLAWDFGQIVWRPHRDTVLHTRRGPRTTPRAPPPTIAMAPLCYRVLASLLPGRGRGGTHPVEFSPAFASSSREFSWAGVLAAVVLVFGIAQVPALTVTLPAIAWVWSRGGNGTGEALIYTAHWLVSGMADNVLSSARGCDLRARGVRDVLAPLALAWLAPARSTRSPTQTSRPQADVPLPRGSGATWTI